MALIALRREVRPGCEGRRGSAESRGPGQRQPAEDADRVWAARALGIGWILGAGGLVVARQSLSGADGRNMLTILTTVSAAVGVALLIRRVDVLRGARLDAVLLMTTSTVGLAAAVFPADPATMAVSVVLTVPFACSLLPVVRAWLHAGYVVLVAAVVVGLSTRTGELGRDVAGLRLLQLTVLVGIVGLVVRRLTERARRRTRIAEAVAAFGHRALTVTEPDELLSKALRVAVDVIGADYGTALRRLPDGRSRVAAELGRYPIAAGSILPDPPAGSYARQIMQSGQAFVSVDLRHDRRITPPLPLLRRGIVSGLAVPVLGSSGTLGVLALHSRERRHFTRDEIAAATALAGVVATAWEQAAQRETIIHQAMHDALTGLPNRALFLDRLDLALSRRLTRGGAPETETTVMLIDLDNFKRVNDSLGHLGGDELLATVAQRLLGAVRPEDTVARLGGDEFAVLCTKTEDEHAAGRLLARLQAVLAEPIVAAGVEVSVTACVGVTMGHRLVDAPATARALLGEADAALYIAKQEGRGRSRHFDERLQVQARQRLQLETDLRHALDHDEFVIHYQPIRSVADHHVLGVEALVRWQHPQRGLVPPDEFIPIAEQTGLIVPLGRWVLHTAAAQVARWQRSAMTYEALWVSVNVSPRQLDDPDLPAQVAAVLQETGLRAGSLSLELTETALLEDGTGLAALKALRDAGARLVLDDFGTGYSSLTHLTRFPIEAVKIDRSFVAGLGTNTRDSAVVAAVITLGAQLGMQVVAEGVETPRQLALLSQAGCYAVQGYLMDRPSLHPSLDPDPLTSQPAAGAPGDS